MRLKNRRMLDVTLIRAVQWEYSAVLETELT